MVLKTELTNICNANCIFCGYQYLNRPKGFMLDETFSKVIKDYRCMGGTTLSFVPVVGDPLVDRRFLEKVREAKQNGFSRIYAYTNGIWLYRFNPLELLSSGLDSLVFSVPPMEKQKFEILYRSSEYEGLLRGLRALLEENAKAGWPVEISFRVRSDMPAKQVLRLPDYQEHVKPFLREESSQVGISLDYDDWGGMIKQEVLVGEMRLTKLKVIRRMPCQNLFNLTVLWNGDVHADSVPLTTTEVSSLAASMTHL
jgi:molybdenum cofactor biosynthesis enzyme MoaA